jgi:cytochrome P450
MSGIVRIQLMNLRPRDALLHTSPISQAPFTQRYYHSPKNHPLTQPQLETLRLYPPIINLFKSTQAPQTLTYRSQPLPLPPYTTIFLEAVSLHRNPKYWSPSPDLFLPSRWLKDPTYTPPPNTLSESPAHANLLCPQKGSYIPFGAGMRSCLGKKFAQVEFCTIVAVLLKGYSVELVDDGGKGWEEKRREALECLDRRQTIIALRMLGKVKVRFVRRGAESFP